MKTLITFIIISTLFLTSCNSSDDESSGTATYTFPPANLEVSFLAGDFNCFDAFHRELDIGYDEVLEFNFIDMDDNDGTSFNSDIDTEIFSPVLLLFGTTIISDFNSFDFDPNETYTEVSELRNADTSAVINWCQEQIPGARLLRLSNLDNYIFPTTGEAILSEGDSGCFAPLGRELNIEYDPILEFNFIDMDDSDGPSFNNDIDTEIISPLINLLGTTVIFDFDSFDPNETYTQVLEIRNRHTDELLGWCREDLTGAELLSGR